MLRRLPHMAVLRTAALLAKAKLTLPEAYALKSARWRTFLFEPIAEQEFFWVDRQIIHDEPVNSHASLSR